MKKFVFLLLLTNILVSFQLFSQDTISVFFEFGKAKIASSEFEKLNSIPSKYENIDIDSILYIGRADSVGNYKANLKLSEKRAHHVAEYLQKKLPETIITKSLSLGESMKFEKDKNRRLDIIIYFQRESEIVETSLTEEAIQKIKCYNIDYNLLHQCLIKKESKKDKNYITLESQLKYLKKANFYYYGTKDSKGNFIEKRVKWIQKSKGILWWKKTRFYTSIPQEDFEKYKVFRIKQEPCDTCNVEFNNQTFDLKEDSCLQIDYFLMQNFQYKQRLFNPWKVEIRVPKEFVDTNQTYYYTCKAINKVVWEEKSGRSKVKYYYTEVPVLNFYLYSITRKMLCCKYNPIPTDCERHRILCGFRGFGGGLNRSINAEIGTYYQQKTFIPYAGLGLTFENLKNRFNFLLGTDSDLNFYSSIRYQYNFVNAQFNSKASTSTWKSAEDIQLYSKIARVYLGSDLNSRLSKKEQFLEQNFHLGFAAIKVYNNETSFRLFFNYGVNVSYLKNYSKSLFPFAQVGLNFTFPRN